MKTSGSSSKTTTSKTIVAATKATSTSVKATSTTQASTTPRPVTTSSTAIVASPTTGTIAQYGQCGGTGFTGSTACVAGYTCTVLNPCKLKLSLGYPQRLREEQIILSAYEGTDVIRHLHSFKAYFIHTRSNLDCWFPVFCILMAYGASLSLPCLSCFFSRGWRLFFHHSSQ